MNIISQRGQFTLPLAAWGALGALAIIVGLSIALKVESSRIEGLQTDVATAKASAAQWESMSLACSDSVKQAQEAAAKAQKQAQDALRKARQANASADAQKRALDDSRGKGLTCEGAVAKVRGGLTK